MESIKKTCSVYQSNLCFGFSIAFGVMAVAMLVAQRRIGPTARDSALIAAGCALFGAFKRFGSSSQVDEPRKFVPLIRHVEKRMDLRCSLLIPAFNRSREVKTLLRRLDELVEAAGLGKSIETVLVDDGSTDDTAGIAEHFVTQSGMDVRVVRQTNGGHSAARNSAFQHAAAEFAISIDSDCLPDDEWLTAMLDTLIRNPDSLVFGQIRSDRRIIFPIEQSPAGMSFVTATFGLCVDTYLKSGGLDTDFRGILEDRDFALRLESMGFTTLGAAAASAWHPIRTVAFNELWHSSQNNRFEPLLARRHGRKALRFLRNRYYGGAWFGNFPTALISCAFLTLSIVNAILSDSKPERARREDGKTLLLVGTIFACAYAGFAVAIAVAFKVPPRRIPGYVASLCLYAIGSSYARVRGSLEYGPPLI